MFQNLAGQKFGRWTAIKREADPRPGGFWLCRCECGREKIVKAGVLKSGESRSCGCFKLPPAAPITLTRRVWLAMHYRCYNPKCADYRLYGARGIRVCERWHSYESFLADMGEKPAGRSLDRQDNDGNYEPGNCRWATPQQQSSNRRGVRLLTANGITQTVTEWARTIGRSETFIQRRLLAGVSPEDIFTGRVERAAEND